MTLKRKKDKKKKKSCRFITSSSTFQKVGKKEKKKNEKKVEVLNVKTSFFVEEGVGRGGGIYWNWKTLE